MIYEEKHILDIENQPTPPPIISIKRISLFLTLQLLYVTTLIERHFIQQI